MTSKLSKFGLLAGVLLIGTSQANAGIYTFTDLGAGVANAINNAGQVAGGKEIGRGGGRFSFPIYQATVWNGTTATSLNMPVGFDNSIATAINDAGQVAGNVSQGVGFFSTGNQATVWNGKTATILDTPLGYTSYAAGINKLGQVAGTVTECSGFLCFSGAASQATVWNGTTATSVGSNQAGATAINNAGQVAGTDNNGNPTATLWNGTKATSLGNGYAYAINDAGQVAGAFEDSSYNRTAIVWNGTTATSLGNGYADAINNIGQVVGYSYDTLTATIWTMKDNVVTTTDLNSFLTATEISAGWMLQYANGINDSGSIVGQAYNRLTGVNDAFLLSANAVSEPSANAVPEPGTCATLLAGLGVMGFTLRRRRKTS